MDPSAGSCPSALSRSTRVVGSSRPSASPTRRGTASVYSRASSGWKANGMRAVPPGGMTPRGSAHESTSKPKLCSLSVASSPVSSSYARGTSDQLGSSRVCRCGLGRPSGVGPRSSSRLGRCRYGSRGASVRPRTLRINRLPDSTTSSSGSSNSSAATWLMPMVMSASAPGASSPLRGWAVKMPRSTSIPCLSSSGESSAASTQ
mmetsp:Transcript_23847/g.77002  ORF Transcript_23847/g.77002 Transcript_23847/m.77002 type:complete len:204 (+) Transcript_23847:522-1133(+)|eukprot:scaffold2930_cov105-Isochrysis_galbana.AAC.6